MRICYFNRESGANGFRILTFVFFFCQYDVNSAWWAILALYHILHPPIRDVRLIQNRFSAVGTSLWTHIRYLNHCCSGGRKFARVPAFLHDRSKNRHAIGVGLPDFVWTGKTYPSSTWTSHDVALYMWNKIRMTRWSTECPHPVRRACSEHQTNHTEKIIFAENKVQLHVFY